MSSNNLQLLLSKILPSNIHLYLVKVTCMLQKTNKTTVLLLNAALRHQRK